MLVASIPPPANNASDANEDVYSFTKRLCQLLSIIGTRQLGKLFVAPFTLNRLFLKVRFHLCLHEIHMFCAYIESVHLSYNRSFAFSNCYPSPNQPYAQPLCGVRRE